MDYNRFEDPKHIKWAKAVKQRDNYTCQVCGARKVYLNSHHKNSWDYFEKDRFNVDNGVTLCITCHKRFHEIYGSGKNTYVQFEEFCRIVHAIKQVIREKVRES